MQPIWSLIITGLAISLFFVALFWFTRATRSNAGTSQHQTQQLTLLNERLQDYIQQQQQQNQNLTQLLQTHQTNTNEQIHKMQLQFAERLQQSQQTMTQQLNQHREQTDKHQFNTLKSLTDSLQTHFQKMSQQLMATTKNTTEMLCERVGLLNQSTEKHLKEITQQVEKRLHEGFEKTTTIFNDVTKRLHLIDKAQQKITELSTSVVSLKEILADKRSRGALGEVQLSALIRNMLPENNFAFQYTLSNNKRVDCMLFLPDPTGHVPIDAKFPLESFKIMTNVEVSNAERTQAEARFRLDIRKHIQDISGKYIIPGETADGAVMFIPAEAIFAEIHSRFPDLVEFAYKHKVWLVSPTTLMAILTTARAVLKDEATRKQVHIIQEHLGKLAKDFKRFEKRMDNLSKHIDQAHHDVQDVKTSAHKLTSRFTKIEQVELQSESSTPLVEDNDQSSITEQLSEDDAQPPTTEH